jgi:hypothetical protein
LYVLPGIQTKIAPGGMPEYPGFASGYFQDLIGYQGGINPITGPRKSQCRLQADAPVGTCKND